MRALQAELDATERNRAELATLLEATVASAGGVRAIDSSRRQNAAIRIQCAWRACLARRQREDLRTMDPYDVIVCFESLSTVIDPDSLRINILRWAGTAFDICASQLSGVRIVAHMGLFDKGKTWLINTLYGKNLPSGKLHETSGLSMVPPYMHSLATHEWIASQSKPPQSTNWTQANPGRSGDVSEEMHLKQSDRRQDEQIEQPPLQCDKQQA
ncbi:unnamed protein product [Prorocentrum cordatum]|uniref:Uncharacterized protein n=1 Tax=Prorocentrum cordatum TaxID=2364126 RepID=A0ABN9X124_9DINO|nr:unnamed protein product [Polarella glacialis]